MLLNLNNDITNIGPQNKILEQYIYPYKLIKNTK